MMKTYLYQAAFAACLFLTACNESKTTDGEITVIPVGAALDAPSGLKASDYFKQVSYVALETNDSCLVGTAPRVQLIKDKILISTNQEQCLMFDKTGKFIKQVGHIGNDPEGYSSVYCWGNNETGDIYFWGWNNELVCYDQEGLFKEKIKIPFEAEGYAAASYNYLTNEIFVGHKEGILGANGSALLFFRNNEPITSFQTIAADDKPFDPSNIASISVVKNEEGVKLFGPTAYSGVVIVNYKEPETGSISFPDNTSLWRQSENLYFKEAYNDTIYQVKDTTIVPSSIIDLGKYHWKYSDRYMKNKDNAALITQILDSKDRMIIRFITKLFHGAVLHDAVVTKSTGEVKVGLYADGMKDDLTNFLPLQPMTVSPVGEYAGLIPAADVVEWFDEHKDSKELPQQVKDLKQIGEEDNPIVVIMK